MDILKRIIDLNPKLHDMRYSMNKNHPAIWQSMSIAVILLFGLYVLSCRHRDMSYSEWRVYKGGVDANNYNYNCLNQVHKSNVKDLEEVWSFYPEDEPEDFRIWKCECNPIVIKGVMYFTSARQDAPEV